MGLAASLLLAYLITALFMFALRPIARAVNLVDVQRGHKRHSASVPVTGGISMSLGLYFVLNLFDHPEFWDPVVLAAMLLVMVGTIDDRFDLPASVRLIAQTCAAMLVIFGSGILVVDLGEAFFIPVNLGVFSLPFTLLFVVTIINAFNVVDGIDGLAGSLSLLCFLALAVVGVGSDVFSFSLVMAAIVSAFLLFNLPIGVNKAVRAFMGDAGSTFLGVIVAALGVAMCQGESPQFSPVIGLWFVAVPVFDLFSAAIRRVMERRSPFAPDHEHLHHVLITSGLSPKRTLLFMLAWGTAFVAVGLVGHAGQVADSVMVVLWFAALVVYYQMMRRPKRVVAILRQFDSVLMRARLGRT